MADTKKRDYYEVLGVAKNATSEEIKKAFRKKAMECHPDQHPGDKDAEARFKELNEANEVLSDPDKRARYDQFGFNDPMSGMGGGADPFGAGGFGFGMDDILNSFFGGMGGGSRRSGPVAGNDLHYEMKVTFEEAADGCTKTFDFYRTETCDVCGGSGAKPGTSPITCSMCNGTGQIRQSGGFMSVTRTCPNCRGTGKMVTDRCPGCGGSGTKRVKRTESFKVPAGIDNGQTVRLSGHGDHGLRGGPSGDLYVTVLVKEHKLFAREGSNLYLEVPISFTQAALGAEIDVPTLHSSVRYKIPEGTQTATEFRVKGQGIQRLNGTGKGDLLFRVRVETPRRLSDKQKDLLRQLEDSSTGKEYAAKKSFMDKIKSAFN